jgi:hypothetical protein
MSNMSHRLACLFYLRRDFTDAEVNILQFPLDMQVRQTLISLDYILETNWYATSYYAVVILFMR